MGPDAVLVTWNRSSVHCFEAEAFDGCEDFVGRFDPFVRFWIGIMRLDERHNIRFHHCDRAMQTALHLLAGQLREPAFDLVQPTG